MCMYSPRKRYEWVTPLIKMGLRKQEMVIIVKRRNKKMVADSKIKERELDAHAGENRVHSWQGKDATLT